MQFPYQIINNDMNLHRNKIIIHNVFTNNSAIYIYINFSENMKDKCAYLTEILAFYTMSDKVDINGFII